MSDDRSKRPAEQAAASGRDLQQVNERLRELVKSLRTEKERLFEELAADVTSWPSRAAEFYTLLGWSQNINHLHLDRARTVDLRNGDALGLIAGDGAASGGDEGDGRAVGA